MSLPSPIESLFYEALEKSSAAERSAFLQRACADDAALRNRVERLAQAHDDAGDFLEAPLALLVATDAVPHGTTEAGPNRESSAAAAHKKLVLDILDPAVDPRTSIGAFGPYQVTDLLGRGGMGVVLKAWDPALQRIVALKVLAPAAAVHTVARQRFLREARTAAAVKHDHVVTIHSIGEYKGLPYLSLEYVAGGSLQDWIGRRGPLPIRDVVEVGRQIAAGLSCAHGQGLIHRDIKPANILLQAEGRGSTAQHGDPPRSSTGSRPSPPDARLVVKITDFGIARAVDDATITATGMVTGTPQYMSPEQARGERLDHRSDLFSLGGILYAACTGRPPFRAPSTMATLHKVCNETPVPVSRFRPDAPERLAVLITRLLEKDADCRLQSAKEVEQALADCVRDESGAKPCLVPVEWARARTAVVDRNEANRSPVAHETPPSGTAVDTGVIGAASGEVRGTPVRPAGLARKSVRVLLACLLAAAASAVLFGAIPDSAQDRLLGHLRFWVPGSQAERPNQESASAERFARGGDDADRLASLSPAPKRTPDVGEEPFREGIDDSAQLYGELREMSGGGRLNALALSPDGTVVYAASSDETIYQWNVSSGRQMPSLTGHDGPVTDLALSPDGRRLASGSGDRTLRIWNTQTGTELFVYRLPLTVFRLAFAPDGNWVLASLYGGESAPKLARQSRYSADYRSLMLFDAAGGDDVRMLSDSRTAFYWSLAFSPDGKTIAAGSREGPILLLDAESGQQRHRLIAHKGPTHALAFTPDGTRLYSGANDGKVYCWAMPKGAEVSHWGFRHPVKQIGLSSDQAFMLFAGTLDVRVFYTTEFGEGALVSIPGHTSPVTDLQLLPDGKRAVSASWDGTVRLWKLPPRKPSAVE